MELLFAIGREMKREIVEPAVRHLNLGVIAPVMNFPKSPIRNEDRAELPCQKCLTDTETNELGWMEPPLCLHSERIGREDQKRRQIRTWRAVGTTRVAERKPVIH